MICTLITEILSAKTTHVFTTLDATIFSLYHFGAKYLSIYKLKKYLCVLQMWIGYDKSFLSDQRTINTLSDETYFLLIIYCYTSRYFDWR